MSEHRPRQATPPKPSAPAPDLNAYAGYWVALIGQEIVGVGQSAEAAQTAAHYNRPRERISAIVFVPLVSP